ncbi:MAG TPA: aminotransferase class III-fold pyridoxal phosphate-dependent enzyme, partial [Solirubrobacteraceae bacterium]|nr:aminotransferase class III-fold pyridoxal phosphate-dependent enzyme [Solirubrobacteraceae bacterium]
RVDRSLERSADLLARARQVIPGASQTMSKGPTQWVQGVAPAYLQRGAGARVWDVDGNEFLDFPMALGPILLGHGHPAVNEAIARQLRDGITFTLPHPLEVEVAERVVAAVPGVERVRFAKAGSDATSAAVRLARAVTGRDRVVVAGYHGWHDWYIASTSRRLGIPAAVTELVETVASADLEALAAAFARHAGEVACVVLEPAGVHEPAPGHLQRLVDLAHEHGALVVFDEVITGFRLAMGGAQERYGVRADLVCFGKALGNGMPISALAGRAQHMDLLEQVFFSGTHGGETLSLAAAAATLDVLTAEPVHEHLWRLGTLLQDGVRAAIAAHGLEDWVTCSGAAPWTIVAVREPHPDPAALPAKTLLQQEMLKRGVLFNGSNFVSWAHTEDDIAEAVDAYDAALARLAQALPDDVEEQLEGPPVSQVFRAIT